MEEDMNVVMLALTKPLPNAAGPLNSEQWLAYIARISNPKNQTNLDTSAKLLGYLAKNQHWSPFEMIQIVMQIETTRDIARQILRHRSFSFQEFSQRYADPTELGFEYKEARIQDKTNRQSSNPTNDKDLKLDWETQQELVKRQAVDAYNWAIGKGIAKEQARAVLPEGMMMSRLYMAGSLRSWIHYCQLRCANGTQKEHAEIAKECWKLISKEFPSLSNLVTV
jgi:thymidylate synthase (FAD)